jgi:hypothetical protein
MDVKIIDNFLDIFDFRTATAKLNSQDESSPWYVHLSNGEDTNAFLARWLNQDEFFTKNLFNQVKRHLDEDYKLERVYCNAQWHGREGELHTDNCDVTALLFLHHYKYGWGGFTEILTDPPCVIQPIPNRLIIFPGMVEHKGYSFAYQHCPMRLSLAFKLNKQ